MGTRIALLECESGGSMKFSIRKYIRIFMITSLTTTSLVLFQNCSNYSAHLSTEGLDGLNTNTGVDDGASHIASTDVIPEVADDSVPIQIDPVDSHSDLSSTAPVGGDPTGMETNPMEDPGSETTPPVVTPPVVVNPPVVTPPEVTPPVVVNPPVVTPPEVTPPVVVEPPVVTPPVVINPPVVIPPTPPAIQEKPACFASSGLDLAEDSYGSTIITSDGNVVVSSDQRPVITGDGQNVVYGDGTTHSTETTTTTKKPRINCSYYAQSRDQNDILVLSYNKHNNARIQADSCGVKVIVYDGVEPLRLKSVTAKDIHICGNIKIEELEAKGGTELTNVQVDFARIKGNLTTFKVDNGFRVPVSERKAGRKAKNSYVNSNFEIIPL